MKFAFSNVAIIAPRDEPFGIRRPLFKGSSRGAMMATLVAGVRCSSYNPGDLEVRFRLHRVSHPV